MTRDRDAFVFYSAVAIAAASLFIGHEAAPDVPAPLAQAPVPQQRSALPRDAGGGAEQRPLVLAVSREIR